MTGSLQVRNGKFYAVLSYKDEMGKWRQKWINSELPIKDNKRKADLFLTKTLSEYNNSNVTPCSDILFSDFMTNWLETIASSIELNTFESYKANINRYINPHFTKTKIVLQNLKPQDIQAFYNKQSVHGLSSTSVLSLHANIRKALQHAVKMNMIAYNPADRVTLPKKQKYRANFYTAEQTNTMLEVFKDEEMYVVVLIAAFYGLRRSEVLGLKWKHVDFNTNTLIICDTVVRCGNTISIDKSRTKTAASHRTLPLTPSMREYLLTIKNEQETHRALLRSAYIDNDYVCKRKNGEPFAPNYISCKFNKVLKKHELPHIRFHDLRHSAASMLLAEKHSLKEIQEWLGHGDLATTADIYAHLQFEAKQDMAKSMDGKFKIG